MHNCRRTQAKLTDLLFDELPAAESSLLRADIEACDECARQYVSLTATLALFDEATDATPPKSESYWLAYNNRLRDQLQNPYLPQLQSSPEAKRASLWRRALTMRVQIPVPALAVIAFAVTTSFLSLLIFRPATRADNSLRNAQAATAATTPLTGSNNPLRETPARIIEVPVVREKIVTRIIYVNRKSQEERRNATRRNNQPESFDAGEGRLARAAVQLPHAPLARPSLAGFQPTNEVKLTVIKASEKQK